MQGCPTLGRCGFIKFIPLKGPAVPPLLVTCQSEASYLRFRGVTKCPTQACTILDTGGILVIECKVLDSGWVVVGCDLCSVGRDPKFGSGISLFGELVRDFNYFKEVQVFECLYQVGSHQDMFF